MPTEAGQVSQGNFLIPDGAIIGGVPAAPVVPAGGSMSIPIGSISTPIIGGPVTTGPVMGGSGYIPQVGEKQYPEGVPVGTLPFEVPPQPDGTPLTDNMCSALGVPRGTLWGGGPEGVTVQQEV